MFKNFIHSYGLTVLRSYGLLSCSLFSFLLCFGQAPKSPKDSPRFVYQSSLSIAYGVGKINTDFNTLPNQNLSFEIQQVIAYQFNNYFFTGIGAGLDFWFCDKKVSTFIPIFANATVKFLDKKTAPFAYANLGYAFKWQAEKKAEENVFYGTKAGIYLQSGVGLNLKFSEKISLLFSAYYKMQQSTVQYRESELLLAETKNQLFHFVGIKIGVLY
jgi:hypothetical protein